MAQETTWKIRLRIIELKKQGLTAAQTAEQLGLSLGCVRKFWRRFAQHGTEGLKPRSRRPPGEHPRQTSAAVREAILAAKRAHPHWGAQFIQGELRRRKFRRIPHRRTIERFLGRFPEFPKRRYQRRPPVSDPRRATRQHELWEMDFKIDCHLAGTVQRKSFLNVRDMASTKCILTYTLPRSRSALTSQEVIDVLQLAFARWKCLPEAIRTDHGSCFCAPEWDAFPTDFTLYLWGLGVAHELIPVRRPTHNGGIERDQRTFGEQFLADYPFHGDPALSQDAETFGRFRNQYVPSRSVRCHGRTPVETAHDLECRARPYRAAREADIFDVQRIFARLSQLRWRRKVTGGYVSLGHTKYYVGRAYRNQTIELTFDANTREVVAATPDHEPIKRWPIRGISYHAIVHPPKSKCRDRYRRKSA